MDKVKVFLDLDGVMVDLEAGAKKVGFDFARAKNEVVDAFWFRKDVEEDFWADLPPMTDFKALYAVLSRFDPVVLTAAPHVFKRGSSWFKQVENGKRRWVAKNLSEDQEKRMIVTFSKEKHLEVVPGFKCILIDDHSSNIKRWEAAGGIGILHKSAEETIHKFNQLIGETEMQFDTTELQKVMTTWVNPKR